MKKIASFTCNEYSTGDYTSNFSNMKLFVFFLYIGFCIASFVIPDSVAFGESLCFAFSYAMVQVLEVALFTSNAKFLVIGMFQHYGLVLYSCTVKQVVVSKSAQKLCMPITCNMCSRLFV